MSEQRVDRGRLLYEAELIERLCLSNHKNPKKALWRLRGKGLKTFKFGQNVVCYERDLEAFLDRVYQLETAQV